MQDTIDREKLRSRLEQALDHAAKLGATEAEVSLGQTLGLDVTVRKQDVETVEFNQSGRMRVTVYLGQRQGSATTSATSDDAIKQAVEKAVGIARYTQEDEFAGLAPVALLATKPQELDLYHPWDLNTENARDQGLACEAEALAVGGVLHTEGASVSTMQGISLYGNSLGFVGDQRKTQHSISCSAVAKDDRGMQVDGWYSATRNPHSLEAATAIGRKAGERATSHLGARKMPSGNMPVVFSPEASRGLVSHLMSAIAGSSLYRRASFLVDRLGEQVTSAHISLDEDPFVPGALGSAWYDGDGVSTSAKPFIKDGVLASYSLDTYAARRLGMVSTGNAGGAHNLSVVGNTLSVSELLRTVGNGVLVTSLMGQGVNIVTGDYSRGAQGFRIENGAISHAVDEITIASNLAEMFNGITAIGDDVDLRGNIRAPSILIASMTVAGNQGAS